jgi:hypothetical protein
MNNFTYENTKDATHVYNSDIVGLIFRTRTQFLQNEMKSMGRSYDAIPSYVIELSRPHNETREHWTTNGVTQYAQPQGNEMDIKKMIPIDFSRKITPFVMGDKLLNAGTGRHFEIDDKGQLSAFNKYDKEDKGVYFVSSFADRPNTGTQPVGDDVVVDVKFNNKYHEDTATSYRWALGIVGSCDIFCWKPNHAAMLKQWQAEQLEEAHDIALQADVIVSKLKENSAIKTLKQLNYSYCCGEYWKPPIGKKPDFSHIEKAHYVALQVEAMDNAPRIVERRNRKPTFTQAQADAGEFPAVGSRVMYLAGTGIKKDDGTFTKGYWDETTIIAHHNDMTWLDSHGIQSDIDIKPIQTDEDRLRSALSLVIDVSTKRQADEIADGLLSSDKFTIKLNEE